MDVAFACFDQHNRSTIAPAAAAMARPTQRSNASSQAVLWWSTPDSRHPFCKDLHLDCGHVLVNRPMRRGDDGKFHVAKRVRCSCCAQGLPAKPKRLPGFVAPAQPATKTQRLDTVTVGESPSVPHQPDRPFKITTAWSPRDLAARNWD
jgi:hypothetical protein